MNESSFDHLESLIAGRTGLKLRLRQRETLKKATVERLIALGMTHLDEYNENLKIDSAGSKAEWELIVGILTNNETYFFRDRGQIGVLRERILPELIARNEATRTLRLWSAGCSTGEEAYTLAILVNELLPKARRLEGRGWKISILGTDIDEPSLRTARRGVYGPWSFRTMDLPVKQRYFDRQAEGWKISPECRSVVTLQSCNLIADTFPNKLTGIQDMDLILCRNVFIYFEHTAMPPVIDKFARTLREGGYLMTGHVETSGRVFPTLETRSFPESDVYQRITSKPKSIHQPMRPAPKTAYDQGRLAQSSLRVPPAERRPQPTGHSIPRSRNGTEVEPASSDLSQDNALLNGARAFADLGRYEEAIGYCERLIEKQPFATESYVILASIAQERGRSDEAKRHLKKAIYLSPASPHLYLEIGAVYRSEGDTGRASKMDDTALALLQQIPPETVVGSSGGPSAQEWISHLSATSQDGI